MAHPLEQLIEAAENGAERKAELEAATETPVSVLRAIVERVGAQRVHDALTPAQRLALRYLWSVWARPSTQVGPREYRGQVVPSGHWRNALVLAGRGFGKSRLGVEWGRSKAEGGPGSRGALIGTTASEVRKVLGFGASGVVACCPPWNRPLWSVVDQCFVWPNGAKAFLFSGDAPDSLRGHEFDWALLDEAAAIRYIETVWSNLQLALRRGRNPQCLITTTPRPIPWLRRLVADPDTILIRGSTFDNRDNLPGSFLDSIDGQFGGSSLGRQEIGGELLGEAEGALWRTEWIERGRVDSTPQLTRIAVGLDPSASSLDEHDECGIVAVGLGVDGHGYVLEDATMIGSPEQWARRTAKCYHEHEATVCVVENTRGGSMCETVIKLVDRSVKVKNRGAGSSKKTRAEPIAALYELGRIHHVGRGTLEAAGPLDKLETELTGWIPPAVESMATGGEKRKGKSPNRMDALVWAASELLIKPLPPKTKGMNEEGQSPRRRIGPFG